jgi:aspartate carbamoyltransferase catalytic subunit
MALSSLQLLAVSTKTKTPTKLQVHLGGDVSAGRSVHSVHSVLSFGKGKTPASTSNGSLNKLQSSLLSGCRNNTVTVNLRLMKQYNVSDRVYRVVYKYRYM